MFGIIFLQPLVHCIYYVWAQGGELTHMLEERNGNWAQERNPNFKVSGEEHSSSVVQTLRFISHSRCVDCLFNWIFVRARQRQRTIVVAVEKRMIAQGKGRVRVIFGACFWKHKPNYHRGRARPCVQHVDTHANTSVYLLWTSPFAIWLHYRILNSHTDIGISVLI